MVKMHSSEGFYALDESSGGGDIFCFGGDDEGTGEEKRDLNQSGMYGGSPR
jgi:hypothetical protein